MEVYQDVVCPALHAVSKSQDGGIASFHQYIFFPSPCLLARGQGDFPRFAMPSGGLAEVNREGFTEAGEERHLEGEVGFLYLEKNQGEVLSGGHLL